MISKKRSTLKHLQGFTTRTQNSKPMRRLLKVRSVFDKQLIDAPLLRYELANGERHVRVSKEGKPSQTVWKVAKRFKQATLVQRTALVGSHPSDSCAWAKHRTSFSG